LKDNCNEKEYRVFSQSPEMLKYFENDQRKMCKKQSCKAKKNVFNDDKNLILDGVRKII